MRTVLTGLILVAAMAWSFESRAQLQPPPPMYPPPAAAPAPNWGFPNAPPPSPPMQAATTQQLEQQSNSFRGLEIAWANVEAGGGYVGMPSKFGYGSTSGAGGPAFGLGVGGRFLTWTLGVRGRVMPMSKFTLVQAMLEAGYHLPVGAWDPYLNIRGGYVTALLKSPGDLNLGTPAAPVLVAPLDVPNPHGVDLGISTGDDYYLSALFSVGMDVSFDALFLSRGAGSASGELTGVASTSGIGVVVVGSQHAGLHFDL